MRSLAFIFLLFCSSVAYSQRWVTVSQTSPKFQEFYSKFRSVAQKQDKLAVAALSSFPFERSYGSDAEQYSTETFLERYDEMFSMESVFAQSDPTVFEFKSGYIVLFSEGNPNNHYMFKPNARGYSFYSLKEWVTIKLASTDLEFQSFYSKLRRAAASRNITAAAVLTQFPFKSIKVNYDKGSGKQRDEVTEYSKVDFQKKVRLLVTDFPKSPEFLVERSGTYSLFCDQYADDTCANSYAFAKVGDAYKLVSVTVENR